MDHLVQQEKASIYDQCFRDIARRYPQYEEYQFETIGLWFGATSVLNFWHRFGLDKKLLPDIAESILAASVRMLHHHIYST